MIERIYNKTFTVYVVKEFDLLLLCLMVVVSSNSFFFKSNDEIILLSSQIIEHQQINLDRRTIKTNK